MAALAARCTQKDPKEYIPYFESLKLIEDKVEFQAKICTDQKNYKKAIEVLSHGNEEQVSQSINIITEQRLFKEGILLYRERGNHLGKIKEALATLLEEKSELNEAYKVSYAIQNYDKCLQLAKVEGDCSKIL